MQNAFTTPAPLALPSACSRIRFQLPLVHDSSTSSSSAAKFTTPAPVAMPSSRLQLPLVQQVRVTHMARGDCTGLPSKHAVFVPHVASTFQQAGVKYINNIRIAGEDLFVVVELGIHPRVTVRHADQHEDLIALTTPIKETISHVEE